MDPDCGKGARDLYAGMVEVKTQTGQLQAFQALPQEVCRWFAGSQR